MRFCVVFLRCLPPPPPRPHFGTVPLLLNFSVAWRHQKLTIRCKSNKSKEKGISRISRRENA